MQNQASLHLIVLRTTRWIFVLIISGLTNINGGGAIARSGAGKEAGVVAVGATKSSVIFF